MKNLDSSLSVYSLKLISLYASLCAQTFIQMDAVILMRVLKPHSTSIGQSYWHLFGNRFNLHKFNSASFWVKIRFAGLRVISLLMNFFKSIDLKSTSNLAKVQAHRVCKTEFNQMFVWKYCLGCFEPNEIRFSLFCAISWWYSSSPACLPSIKSWWIFSKTQFYLESAKLKKSTQEIEKLA